jgi:hypothetical protein
MSGSKGGDFTPIGRSEPCDRFKVETALQSPNSEVVESLKAGEVLQLRLDPVRDRHAVVVLKGGKVAGSLVFASLQKLVECIQAGHVFVAEVSAVSGPACRLRVRHQ